MKKIILNAYFIVRLPVIFLLKIMCGFFPHPGGWQVKRILLIRLDRMGDLILSLPVIENLQRAYPQASIDILIRPAMAGCAGLIPGVHPVIYDSFISAAGRLQRQHYDIVVDMLYDYPVRTAALASLTNAPVRIGFDFGFRGILFTHPVSPVQGKDMVAVNLELLKPLNIPAVVRLPSLHICDRQAKTDGRHRVALHPGAHYPSQRWPAEKYAALAQKISALYNAEIIVIGGPGEEDVVAEVMRGLDAAYARAVFPGISELVSLLCGCSLLVCNNSGPLHLAAALGVPTVSTMGPTDPVLWRSQGADQLVVRKNPGCSPCGRAVCRNHECMEEISVEEVAACVTKIIER